jgi:hypothetical protein
MNNQRRLTSKQCNTKNIYWLLEHFFLIDRQGDSPKNFKISTVSCSRGWDLSSPSVPCSMSLAADVVMASPTKDARYPEPNGDFSAWLHNIFMQYMYWPILSGRARCRHGRFQSISFVLFLKRAVSLFWLWLLASQLGGARLDVVLYLVPLLCLVGLGCSV